MLYVGLDLSRKRLDFDARLSSGELFESSLDIWGLTKAKDLRISITIRR